MSRLQRFRSVPHDPDLLNEPRQRLIRCLLKRDLEDIERLVRFFRSNDERGAKTDTRLSAAEDQQTSLKGRVNHTIAKLASHLTRSLFL